MDGDSFDDPCGPTPIGKLGLRIGAIFIIMVTSMFGTLFPILSKRNQTLRRIVPGCEWIALCDSTGEFGRADGSMWLGVQSCLRWPSSLDQV